MEIFLLIFSLSHIIRGKEIISIQNNIDYKYVFNLLGMGITPMGW